MMNASLSKPDPALAIILENVPDPGRRAVITRAWATICPDGEPRTLPAALGILLACLIDVVVKATKRIPTVAPEKVAKAPWRSPAWIYFPSFLSILFMGLIGAYYAGFREGSPTENQAEWIAERQEMDSQNLRLKVHIGFHACWVTIAADRRLVQNTEFKDQDTVVGADLAWALH